jgi:hypothetical protein
MRAARIDTAFAKAEAIALSATLRWRSFARPSGLAESKARSVNKSRPTAARRSIKSSRLRVLTVMIDPLADLRRQLNLICVKSNSRVTSSCSLRERRAKPGLWGF